MDKKTTIISSVLVLIMVVSLASVAAAAPANNTKDTSKLVFTQKVDTTMSFPITDLMGTELEQFIYLVPESILQGIDGTETVTIRLNGMIHANAFMYPGVDANLVKVHLSWSGTMEFTITDEPTITLSLKNAQLEAQSYIPLGDYQDYDLRANFHINGELSTGENVAVDISTHFLLDIQNGQLVKMKVWLPDFGVNLLTA